MTPEEMIVHGADISAHYLKDNPRYRIIRYNENVYAVNLDENRVATDFIHLWKSHKGNNPVEERELGHGAIGTVYAKTEDKVKKSPLFFTAGMGRFPKRNRVDPDEFIQNKSDSNSKILDQLFALKQNGLNSVFVFGLHSIKKPDNPMFFMPKVSSYKPRHKEFNRMQIDFILKLKQVNEMGFAHEDYCGSLSVKHSSFQNEMVTRDGITLIDMDNGLLEIYAMHNPLCGQQARMRDQWLLVYLNKKNVDVLNDLEYWYQTHNYEPISESPEEILKIVKDLPKQIVDSITQQAAQRVSGSSHNSWVTQSSEPSPSYAEELTIATVLQTFPSSSIDSSEQQVAASSIPPTFAEGSETDLLSLSESPVPHIDHRDPQAEASSIPSAPLEELSTDPQSLSESSGTSRETSEQRASSSGPRPDSVEKLKTLRNMVVTKQEFFWVRKHNLDKRGDNTPENLSSRPHKKLAS
ncbi:hypothetical protein BN59_01650 [Legionella massiliensis]|uniref:Dot/Icm T4SS effector n=1 Tax=Legionella massiliensis TaxID=1034943 RepID=A0A078KWJ9_9GAMM|nr:hypothetical protein [Legionella massiliensis]CDZ77367.1 hypothetical protein BN59_01650 [Legionella massiliensis]CEE13105.1 hypothetical protein BN1094_01650 [Legionella massiliensis]